MEEEKRVIKILRSPSGKRYLTRDIALGTSLRFKLDSVKAEDVDDFKQATEQEKIEIK